MIINSRFDILQKVLISAINEKGTVLKIQYEGVEILYQVEYWWNGEIKSVWLYENELKEIK